MTFEEYLHNAERYYLSNIGGMRKGQAYMNFLYDVNPALYNFITGSDADPFYNDRLVPYFLQVVEGCWEFTINT